MNKYIRWIFNNFDFISHGMRMTYVALFVFLSLLIIALGGMLVSHALVVNPSITEEPAPEFDESRWDNYIKQINDFAVYLEIMIYTSIAFFLIGIYQNIQIYRVRQIMKTIDRVT